MLWCGFKNPRWVPEEVYEGKNIQNADQKLRRSTSPLPYLLEGATCGIDPGVSLESTFRRLVGLAFLTDC
jgi:hypothetical protein